MDFFFDSDDVIIEHKKLENKLWVPCQLCPTLQPEKKVEMVERKNTPGHMYATCAECKRIRRVNWARKKLLKI